MNEIVGITVNKDLRSNPKELAKTIVTLSKDIEECRNNLTSIKDRSFWKRTFSNNTRDLADSLIKQNDTISTFMNIVQVLIGFNLHNAVVLGGLYEELNNVSGQTKVSNNEYFQLAQDYIGETLIVAKKTNKKFDEFDSSISNINVELQKKKQIDEEQSKIITFLKQKYHEKDKIDKRQSDEIELLKKSNTEKDKLDSQQSEKLHELEKEIAVLKQLIEEHIKVNINEIENKLIDFSDSLTSNQTKQNDLTSTMNRLISKNSKLQIFFIIYMILSISVIVILAIK